MILRAAATLGLLLLPLAAAAEPWAEPWPEGRVPVREVDGALEQNASRVFDEIERRTLVRFARQGGGGLVVRAAQAAGVPKATDLCCFDPRGGAPMLRQLSLAVIRALGVQLEVDPGGLFARRLGRGEDTESGTLLLPEEADAINELYAAQVLPPRSALPARVEVGIWQLESDSFGRWADMVEGRGRRVVQGAMLWSRGVAAAGQMPGLVAAVPTFVFRGNKAEVVLLGAESAELAAGPTLPSGEPGEGLGAGIRRVTQHARGLPGRGFAGGLPTYLGDDSALLLRSSCVDVRPSTVAGEDTETVLRNRRSAIAWAQVSRWAQGLPGALLGIPSFVEPAAPDQQQALEVLVLRRPRQGAGTESAQPAPEPSAGPSEGGGSSLGFMLAALWGAVGVGGVCCLLTMRSRRSSGHLNRAERDLERLVNSL